MPIKMTPIISPNNTDVLSAIIAKAKELLGKGELKMNLDFSKVITVDPSVQCPYLVFTPEAMIKMNGLVQEYSKEVAWHGVVDTSINELNEITFLVHDILVYPQVITGTTVEADTTEYPSWIQKNVPVLNQIKMQGHSHVNMACNPSGTDTTYYGEMAEQIEDYYIFIIMNKRGDLYVRIYDKIQNVMFEGVPITIKLNEKDESLADWLLDVKPLIAEPIPIKTVYTPPYLGPGANTQSIESVTQKDVDDSYATYISQANEKYYGYNPKNKKKEIESKPSLFAQEMQVDEDTPGSKYYEPK